MEWLVEIGDLCLQTLGWLVGLAIVFAILARFMPCNRGMYWWTDPRGAVTDLLYWFVMPLLLRVCRTVVLGVALAILFGGEPPGFRELTALPLWVQCILVLLIQDVYLYWMHRLFHSHWLWAFHAVHHSSRVLDWVSAARFHLVNNLLSFVVADVGVMLLGFSPESVIVMTPFNLIYSAMVHANLNWTFGPLRFVFASPVFHRWHHAVEEKGMNRNFAPTFPILDVIFGTFHMPAGELPHDFGNGERDYPEDFVSQFFQPFLGRPEPESPPESNEV
ncbi:MAG: sterol desaturase family protein [Planctomycetes bacterium]|nr:sterol desaturase family protein [Planctomycetota bacterium]